MAISGFEVINDYDSVQVTSEQKNLVLIDKYTVSSGDSASIENGSVLAVRPKSGLSSVVLDVNFNFTGYSGATFKSPATVYVFGYSTRSKESSGFGVEVYDSSGDVAYSSVDKPLVVIDDNELYMNNYPSIPSLSKTYPSKEVAIVLNTSFIVWDNVSQHYGAFYLPVANFDGDSVEVTSGRVIQTASGLMNPASVISDKTKWLVVDVTGY